MKGVLDRTSEATDRIGALLDEALAIADGIGAFACGAHIAHALHLLDPSREIARPADDGLEP